MNRTARIAGCVVVLGALFAYAVARAQDPIVVRPQGGVSAPVIEGRVDHSAYEALLQRYVDERGLADYAAWRAADQPALGRYLAAMAAARPDDLADRNERLAYWINVYNALTIHGMLHFYPTRSIRDHVSRLGGFHFWNDVRIEVAGRQRSLDAVEHEILRGMGEPRIHFAIVCASLACPRLRNEAYTGSRLEAQLDDDARGFFNDAAKFRIDRERNTVHLSSILEWFGEDFGGTDRAKLGFAARYVRTEEDRVFLGRDDLSVRHLDYDWSINEKKRQ